MIKSKIALLIFLALFTGCAGTKNARKSDCIKIFENAALVNAAERGDLPEVKRLLDKGMDIMSVNQNGWTSLNIAVYNNHIEVVKYLIEKGADVNHVDNYGWTPLKIAVENKREEIIKLLKEKGAKQ